MKIVFLLLFVVVTIKGLCIGNISKLEYDSLYSLYNSTFGDQWVWPSNATVWTFPSSPESPCSDSWSGLICNRTNFIIESHSCSIISLDLSLHSLRGSLPAEMFNFSSLVTLGLDDNKITGTIPTEIGLLTDLTSLALFHNWFTGPIPSELGGLPLLDLNIRDTFISGTVPTELGNIESLVYLRLSFNVLGGTIPTELGRLTRLRELDLGRNRLEGRLPSELGQLQMCVLMELSTCYFTGTIPSEIGLLTRLEIFGLFTNSLTGPLPLELYNMTSLHHLFIYLNEFTGTISENIGNLRNLSVLDVFDNRLSGPVPSSLGQLLQLQTLFLQDNCLTGTLPSELGAVSGLQILDVAFNSLTGKIPSTLNGRLEFLVLNDNRLTGSLPVEVPELVSLQYLVLGNNHLDSTIPDAVVFMESLQQLLVYENFFSGSIPSLLGTSQVLTHLYLYNNLLSGTIPVALAFSTQLRQMLMQSNSLTGSIPTELQALRFMDTISFADNQLTGTLPDLLRWPFLQAFNVSKNNLHGHVAKFFSNYSTSIVSYLDLSLNAFTGPVPADLFRQPLLRTAALYSNCFTGSLPASICDGNLLSVIVMDGIGSGVNCRSKLPPWLSNVLKGVFAEALIPGTIPTCVWKLQNLTTLHLSGNGLQGTIGELANSSAFVDLNLANNYLTGTIPTSVQTSGRFKRLSLSGNKLSGTLSSGFAVSSTQFELDLTVNRLSGDIPPVFRSAPNVNILRGNLFQCLPSDVPHSDPDSKEYVCGSNDFNISVILWACFLFFWSVVCFVVFRYFPDRVLDTEQIKTDAESALPPKSSMDTNMSSPQAASGVAGVAGVAGVGPSEFKSPVRQSLVCSRLEPPIFSDRPSDAWDITKGDLPRSTIDHRPSDFRNSTIAVFVTGMVTNMVDQNTEYWSTYTVIRSELKNCSKFLALLKSSSWTYRILLCVYIMVCMTSYIVLKSVEYFSAEYSTHTQQYSWVTTSAYLHGVLPVVLIVVYVVLSLQIVRLYFLIGVKSDSEVVQPELWSALLDVHNSPFAENGSQVESTAEAGRASFSNANDKCSLSPASSKQKSLQERLMSVESESAAVSARAAALKSNRLKRWGLPVLFHCINILATLFVNGAYVYAILVGVDAVQLVLLQFVLGMYKLLFNSLVIPRMISQLTFMPAHVRAMHQVAMVIFNYIAGPILATMSTDPSCLYYAFEGSAPAVSVFNEIQKSTPDCIEVYAANSITCILLPTEVSVTTTLKLPWLYSFQCGSAVLTNYIPVLIFCYALSGILFPAVQFALMTLPEAISNKYVHPLVFRVLFREQTSSQLPASPADDGANDSALIEDPDRLLFQSSTVVCLIMLDFSVLMTFGLASPILGVTVSLKGISAAVLWRMRIDRYLRISGLPFKQAKRNLELAASGASRGLFGTMYLVILILAMFWSLMIFDMIADVYGEVAGGIAVVVPLVGLPLLFALTHMRETRLRIKRAMAQTSTAFNDLVYHSHAFSFRNSWAESEQPRASSVDSDIMGKL